MLYSNKKLDKLTDEISKRRRKKEEEIADAAIFTAIGNKKLG